jgi:catechol 2,3-dioxygenase-like lactoylglutathione lyase family enzyme
MVRRGDRRAGSRVGLSGVSLAASGVVERKGEGHMGDTVRVQRLQHVSVPRPRGSADAARRFYGGILGLAETAVPATLAHLDLVWYRMGDDELHLFGDERGVVNPAQHFCIQVDDVEALRRRFAAAGVAIGEEPEIPNRPRFTVRDPFGNLIEVTTILGD